MIQEVMKIFSGPESLGVTEEQINCKTGTLGIPEFGTKFVRQMLEETKPTTFSELVKFLDYHMVLTYGLVMQTS